VRDLGTQGGRSCYSLLLEQRSGDGYAPQGTYRLSHADLGAQLVLVVPLGAQGEVLMRYEVVFN
jgi:hypothetical protein